MLNRKTNIPTNARPPDQVDTTAGFEDRKLIYATKVRGAVVRNSAGQNIGHIEDIAIDAVTGDIAYAVLSLGGILGIGEHVHPIPWSLLEFDPDANGYLVSVSNDELGSAPSYSKSAFSNLRDNDESFPRNIFAYYGIYT
jgi:hypothetical protein